MSKALYLVDKAFAIKAPSSWIHLLCNMDTDILLPLLKYTKAKPKKLVKCVIRKVWH